MGIIYKVVNKTNNKVYIGQTVNTINNRWKSHCNPCMTKRSVLSRAIQKYGKENFTIEEIDGANSLSELNYLEKHYICKFNSLINKCGYNIRTGGNNSNLNTITKEKIREKATGRVHSKETINKMKKSWSDRSIKHLQRKILFVNKNIPYESVTEAAKELGILRRTIYRTLNGSNNKNGYIFKYID